MVNDEFPTFLNTGTYNIISPSLNCMSSAMNVGHPSNISRVVALYGGAMDEKGNISKMPDLDEMRKDMVSYSVTDKETEETIQKAYEKFELLLEPHGAVGWTGLLRYLKDHPEMDTPEQCFVSLETAHPAKFPEKIIELLSFDPPLPPSLAGIEAKEESYDTLSNDYEDFKHYLKERY